jgi:hypothetical protein
VTVVPPIVGRPGRSAGSRPALEQQAQRRERGLQLARAYLLHLWHRWLGMELTKPLGEPCWWSALMAAVTVSTGLDLRMIRLSDSF